MAQSNRNRDEMKKIWNNFTNGLIIAGALILLLGAYYSVIKAGIPYQDPPLELQIQYAVNMGIGDELCKVGLSVLTVGIVGRIIAWKANKK